MTRVKAKEQSIRNRPVKTSGYSSDKLHAKRDRKRREAEIRNAKYRADKGLPPLVTRYGHLATA